MGELTTAIAKAIRASHETPYAIAQRAGVNRSQISRLLSGERGMNSETIEALADALGYDVKLVKRSPRKGR